MEHIVLLGDSVFDNAVYSTPEPSVIEHLRALIPPGWRATLSAVDGAITQGLARQLANAPESANHLFVSVGGNDALAHWNLLLDTKTSGPELLARLQQAAEGFRRNYRAAIREVKRLQKSACVCTIYNGNFGDPIARIVQPAVAIFDDAIYSVANEEDLRVLELRSVFTQAGDYANPIEPSGQGGKKLAQAICEQVIKWRSTPVKTGC